ncbi:hypothetical protein [Desulfomonile tiedjei]|uniref:hypothetical protein n=1 Tax=Desulfomonile tiedjei TaxID=2358 RepID=UPI0012FA091C|nr:hypothetical protein [Desulfomonile tiedjei]
MKRKAPHMFEMCTYQSNIFFQSVLFSGFIFFTGACLTATTSLEVSLMGVQD